MTCDNATDSTAVSIETVEELGDGHHLTFGDGVGVMVKDKNGKALVIPDDVTEGGSAHEQAAVEFFRGER